MTERERKILLHELRMCRTELESLKECPLVSRPCRTIGMGVLLGAFVFGMVASIWALLA